MKSLSFTDFWNIGTDVFQLSFPSWNSNKQKSCKRASYCQDVFKMTFFSFFFLNSQQQLAAASGITVDF